jgi:hypothetical protein
LRNFLQKWKIEYSADSLVPIYFAIFPFHLSKILYLTRKIDVRSYEILYLLHKIILAHLQIWCSKIQPLSGNQRPDLLIFIINIFFVLRLPRNIYLCRSFSNIPYLLSFLEIRRNPCLHLTRYITPCVCHAKRALNIQKWSERGVFRIFWLRNVLRATTACTFSISQLPKVVRTWCIWYILSSKRASRHNDVYFLDIVTSKSGLKMA